MIFSQKPCCSLQNMYECRPYIPCIFRRSFSSKLLTLINSALSSTWILFCIYFISLSEHFLSSIPSLPWFHTFVILLFCQSNHYFAHPHTFFKTLIRIQFNFVSHIFLIRDLRMPGVISLIWVFPIVDFRILTFRLGSYFSYRCQVDVLWRHPVVPPLCTPMLHCHFPLFSGVHQS